jgi:arabinose operon protein AraL
MMFGFIIDLDGTVYRGGALLEGAREALLDLREAGHRLVFVTNNSIANPTDYQCKLTRLGVTVALDEIVSSNQVMAEFLVARRQACQPVFVVGEQPLVDELAAAGLRLTEEWPEAGAVALGWDRQFTYQKLEAICRARAAGIPVYATNPDPMCPVEDGQVPDCGTLIAAVERGTGRPLEAVVGKPSTFMVDAALARLDVDRTQCWVVGDRLETDIRMAREAGLRSALVLTGVTNLEAARMATQEPTMISRDLAEAVRVLREA